ncbi:MoxR family ATPase [Halobacteriovorax sp. HLS]|uniref:AAA family ATPase n=1 Tax=Halobacteriovorax sp. HLS TaxID=2234000 RepID=UPI001F4EFB72|nr:AAA family ATPase [Halobacteriovorax sp. HLS]
MDIQQRLRNAMDSSSGIFLGKDLQVKLAFIALISKGHLLIEDIPGVGKTTLVYLLSHIFGLKLSRIQFTNDLLPSDIIGTSIFNKEESVFVFNRGPIFSQLILADELNRASSKTQSALLQAMEEKYITFDNCEYELDDPFVVIATQNPINQIGTNPLPESQLDRFFMALTLGLPSREYEKKIIQGLKVREQIDTMHSFMNLDDLKLIHSKVLGISVSEELMEFLMDFLARLRKECVDGEKLSVRAGQDLYLAMKACAFLEGRDFATHDDLKFVCPYIISHRLNSSLGLKDGQSKVTNIVNSMPVR